MLFTIAFRNILRNRRRSFVTLLAITIGGMAILLFGEFVGFIKVSVETGAVQNVGHLTLFRSGYFDYGAGNPSAFGIDHYEDVMKLVAGDPEVASRLRVITPTVSLMGIAGNFEEDASKTFMATGYVPGDRDRMRTWDDYRVRTRARAAVSGLRSDDDATGVVGIGVARVLGLCEKLKLANCPPRPVKPKTAETASDLPSLPREPSETHDPHEGMPRLDLLTATADGAPNVMSLYVAHAEPQGARELDDNVIVTTFSLAQNLLYGRGEKKATAIVLQLHHTSDLGLVRARLEQILKANHLDLEIRDFVEREPFFKQVVGMFNAIFFFISVIMGVIVLFTVVNTMGMSVVERTNEIGTARAMGVRRRGIRWLFVMEGALLGAVGGALGVGVGQTVAILFNRVGAKWTPPGQSAPVPLEVLTYGASHLLLSAFVGLLLVATVAAVVPANRAARLKVVDALRHV